MAGFTLIEMMTVMILMLLITTASVVSWNNVKRGKELNAAVNDVRSSLSLARQYAVLKRVEIMVNIISNQVYYITNNTGVGLVRGMPQELPLGAQFTNTIPTGGLKITFKPSGSLLNNQTITLGLRDVNNAGMNAALRINGLTGMIDYE